jgi:hypothetical protein
MEHTRGPWKEHPYNSRMGSLISFGDLIRGETIGIAYAQKDVGQGKANARLIAAAPELIEALTEAFIVMAGKEVSNSPFDMERWVKAVNGVEAAIAKAVAK